MKRADVYIISGILVLFIGTVARIYTATLPTLDDVRVGITVSLVAASFLVIAVTLTIWEVGMWRE